jgi:starvation-inducible DNA-binding protein
MLDDQGSQILATVDPLAERTRKIGGTTVRLVGQISPLQRIQDNEADHVEPQDMLAELKDDNGRLTSAMRRAHERT